MKVLKHPNIVRLLEIIDTEKIMYLVMEYAKGGKLESREHCRFMGIMELFSTVWPSLPC